MKRIVVQKKKLKIKPKSERKPHKERVFTTNVSSNMESSGIKTWCPWEDHMILKRKYEKLFARYQRERKLKYAN